jgi:hypothetical protein
MLERFVGELRWRTDGTPERVPDELGFVRVATLCPNLVDSFQQGHWYPHVDLLHLPVPASVAISAHML